jgi:hypothetical protein
MTTILILNIVPAVLAVSALVTVLARGLARDREEVLVQLTDGSKRRVRLKSLRG